jgi:hypothetical protein
MIRATFSTRPTRVLDFDIEARPLSYLGADFTTRDVTAIAASWNGSKTVEAMLLGEHDIGEILEWFVGLYDRADMVTGHYIRRYDLPNINGALLEAGMAPLGAKLTSDTKDDLVRRQGISVSQESLAEMLGLPAGKYHMTQPKWRKANRLAPDGLEETRRRVVGDVLQHKLMRQALLDRGWLKGPRRWSP